MQKALYSGGESTGCCMLYVCLHWDRNNLLKFWQIVSGVLYIATLGRLWGWVCVCEHRTEETLFSTYAWNHLSGSKHQCNDEIWQIICLAVVFVQVVWPGKGVWWLQWRPAIYMLHSTRPCPIHALRDLGGGLQPAWECHIRCHQPRHPGCGWVCECDLWPHSICHSGGQDREKKGGWSAWQIAALFLSKPLMVSLTPVSELCLRVRTEVYESLVNRNAAPCLEVTFKCQCNIKGSL